MRAADVHIKALLGGIKLLLAQMPFADAGRGIATCLEPLGDGFLLQRQLHRPLRDEQSAIVRHMACDPVGEVPVSYTHLDVYKRQP